MWILSGLGDIDGGAGVLSFWPGVVLVAIWSLIVIWLALRTAVTPAETVAMMVRMEDTA